MYFLQFAQKKSNGTAILRYDFAIILLTVAKPELKE
jgi:hypothetical protein